MTNQWHPKYIRRATNKKLNTGAETVIVETDAGRGYLKGIGNRGGEHILACEFVGTQLASQFGLPTLEYAIIQVDEVNEIPLFSGELVKPGSAFITHEHFGTPWGGDDRELKKLSNKEDITRLIIFDTWTRNCDRYLLGGKRIKLENVFLGGNVANSELKLIAMDHTHCFTCGGDLTRKIA